MQHGVVILGVYFPYFLHLIIHYTKHTMPLNKKEQLLGTFITYWAIVLFCTYMVFSTLGLKSEEQFLLAIAVILIIVACICILIYRKYRKANNPLAIDYLNIGTQRYLLGLFMIFYGISKIFGNFFDYQLFALDSRLVDVSEFELAWYFFGKNRWQELFIGIMEFVPGVLLLSRRTYYPASIILLPVAAQVFILNLFFKIGGVTFPAAIILLACNLYIIYSQKEKIIQFFRSLSYASEVNIGNKTRRLIKVLRGMGLFLALGIVLINVKPLFKSEYQKKYSKLVGVYTLQRVLKNNVTYNPANDSLYYKNLYIEKQSRWNMLRRGNNATDAFNLYLNPKNDSITIYINKGGAGDQPDILDSATALTGVYKVDRNTLTIKGVYLHDTVQLLYTKQGLKPKQWFW